MKTPKTIEERLACLARGAIGRRLVFNLALTGTLLLVLVVLMLFLQKSARAEHEPAVEAWDFSDSDRILNANSTVVLAVNISNSGPDPISFVQFTVPQGFIINGWSTDANVTNGASHDSYWLDTPDVDGAGVATTGGNYTPTAPSLLLTAFYGGNITNNSYEVFILYIDTKNASRGLYQIEVETWDNASVKKSSVVYVALASSNPEDGGYDICLDVRDWGGGVVNVSYAAMLLPQSYLYPGMVAMNTSFNMFPNLTAADDEWSSMPIVDGGLVLWRDGYEFHSNVTDNITYNITTEQWGNGVYIYVVPSNQASMSPIKIMLNLTPGYNGHMVMVDGLITTYADPLYHVSSVYFSTNSSAYSKVFIQAKGYKSGGNVSGQAYYVLMPFNNTETFQCSEITAGYGVYRGGSVDLSDTSKWPDLINNGIVRLEIDLNGDGVYTMAWIHIDAQPPLINDVYVERNRYVWPTPSNVIWYQTNMTQWGIVGYVNISFDITEEHPEKVIGSYAFGELPMGTVSTTHASITYSIESVDEVASAITVTIYDKAGNKASHTFPCSKDNNPPSQPVIVDIELASPNTHNILVDLSTYTLYYRNNVLNMNEQFNIHIADISDGAGESGFWKVTGSYAFNGSAVDSDLSDGLTLSYVITQGSEGSDITITAYDMVSNNISVVLKVKKDNDSPHVDYCEIYSDSKNIYYDSVNRVLYYSNDQSMNDVITITIHARDDPYGSFVGLHYAEGDFAFGDPAPRDELLMPFTNEYTFELKYVISTNDTVVGNVLRIRVYDYLDNMFELEITTIVDNQPPTSIALRDFYEASPYIFFKEGTMYYSNDQGMSDKIVINITAHDDESGLYFAEGPNVFNRTFPEKNEYMDNTYGVGGFTFIYYIDTAEACSSELVFRIYDRTNNYDVFIIHAVLDNSPPETYDDSPEDWVSTNVLVHLYETDNDGGAGVMRTYYTINGSDPTYSSDVYSVPILFTKTGQYTVRYFSVDLVGNTQSIQVSNVIKVDKDYPSITAIHIDPSNLNSTYNGSFVVTLNVIDYGGSGIDPYGVLYDYRFSNGNYSGYRVMTKVSMSQYYFSISRDWWSLANMKLYWKVSIRDYAGNYYNESEHMEYIEYVPPPNHAPVVEVLSPSGYELWTGERYIRWYAEDPDGDELRFDIQVSWDGGLTYVNLVDNLPNYVRYWKLNTTTLTHSPGEPVYRVKVIAREVNTEQKLETAAESELFSIYHPKGGEDHPPELSILYPLGGEKISAPVDVRWHAEDPEGDDMEFEVYVAVIKPTGLMDQYKIGTLGGWERAIILDPSGFDNGSEYRIWIVCRQTTGTTPWIVDAMGQPFEIYHPGILDNHPPTLSLKPMAKDEYTIDEDSIVVEWEADDLDGGDYENLRVSIYISYNGGEDYTLVAEDIDAGDGSYTIDLTNNHFSPSNASRIKVLVSDGKDKYGECVALSSLFKIKPSRGSDWDHDGIPNYWEIYYGLDPEDPKDADFDKDGDGLSNLEEYNIGTSLINRDTDGDGMDDGWEVLYGLKPLIKDASQDLDGDGYTNLQEYINGTDPRVKASHPEEKVTNVGEGGGGMGDEGWVIVTALALMVTLVLMFALYITKPSPLDEADKLEREVEAWVSRLRKERTIITEKTPKKVVRRKKLKPKTLRPVTEKEKEEAREMRAVKHMERVPEDTFIDVYIKEKAFRKMVNHCFDFADARKEVMGFLIGDRYKWNDREYTVISDVVTTDLESSAVYVRFNREGFESLFEDLDKLPKNYIIVGWYHSHPGHTCFLSSTDVRTQEAMFNQPFHTAIVIDPINIQMKAFGVEKGRSYEKSFAVIRGRISKGRGR